MDQPDHNPPDEFKQALARLPQFLTVRLAAEFLCVHPETIRGLVRRREITAIRPAGHSIRIPRSAFIDYLEKNTWHAQEKAQGSSACPAKQTGTSKTATSDEMAAVSRFQQEQRIGKMLSAF